MLKRTLVCLVSAAALMLGCQAEGKKSAAAHVAKAKTKAGPASQPAKGSATKPATATPTTKPATGGAATAAMPGGAGDAAAGKGIFLKVCANCHGADGTGSVMRQMMPKIGNLTAAELHGRMNDQAIYDLVSKGRGKMPPMGGALKPEQIKNVIAYVRTLKK